LRSFPPCGVALLVLAASGAACSDAEPARTEPAPHVHVASASCPLKTPDAWQAFLVRAVADESWVTTCSDLGNCQALVGEFSARVEDEVLGTFAACQEDLHENPRIAECTERLERYAHAWLAQHSSDSYGFRTQNAEYFAAQEGPEQAEGMMAPPRALLEALPERRSIERVAEDRGWPYLVHDSCLGGVRLFVNIADPAGRFDQWLLFGLDGTLERVEDFPIVSFLAVEKRNGQGQVLPRVRLHFRDYVARRGDDATWQLELPETMNGKCYACHTSGLRQLVPFLGAATASAPVRGEEGFGSAEVLPDFAARRLAQFNEKLAGYGLPDWNGTIVLEDHGPPLGRELGCITCHDNQTRGALTVSTSEGMLYQKVVDQLAMRSYTPGEPVPDEAAMALLTRERAGSPALSEAERLALERARAAHLADYAALVAARFPDWSSWVLERSCR
jgi:hypothetical protein